LASLSPHPHALLLSSRRALLCSATSKQWRGRWRGRGRFLWASGKCCGGMLGSAAAAVP
jgi:hypothetical protein